ncbi:site-specific integrase [Nordella sp. HKS 07]|uniref:site-specific integrase n=1 Tax=Nordella sp. HKS 07 TaxID=2712222 RepID=UPI0013E11F37|nr:site-specific integrase [Nordella sp. HKS 07]QIG47576.1 site-specific integrase [Nordella sp. HKS 07]
MGIAPKTLSNHRSNVKAAIVHFMAVEGIPSRGAPLSPEWTAIIKSITEVKAARLLSGIARYSGVRGIKPQSVNEQIVAAYFAFRRETSLYETGITRQRELSRAWNRCACSVPGWPDIRLRLPDLECKSESRKWAEFPDGLRHDVARYLDQLAKPHRTSKGKRRKPSKKSSIDTRRRELVAFANKAVANGIAIESLVSLPALLAPAVVQTVLEGYMGQDKPTRYVIDLPWKLLAIARSIGAASETIERLEDMREALEAQRGGTMTQKNMTVIRAVMTTDVWDHVCDLPAVMMMEAKRLLNKSPSKAASRAALGVQILLLTRAPVRVSNLLSIRIGHNLIKPGGMKAPYVLLFPEYDVKNRIDLDFPLSLPTSKLIDEFIQLFRPHLGISHRSDWLFPGEQKARNATHASVSIAERMLKETGIRITAHQFRHAAAAVILRANPGNYEFTRRVLGHLNVQTTVRFYAGLESFQASKHFGELIESRLAFSEDADE